MDERVKRARALLADIDVLRDRAVSVTGSTAEVARSIGALAEAVANDVIEMAIELEQHRAAGIDMPRIDRLLRDLGAAIHGADAAPEEPIETKANGATPPLVLDGGPDATSKMRTPEAEKPLDTYELTGADYRALPYDRAWIDGLMPAFRAESAGKVGKRPRVTIAAWLAAKKAAEPAA